MLLQDSCARLLLFRGADKECLNFAGQTAYQVKKDKLASRDWRPVSIDLEEIFSKPSLPESCQIFLSHVWGPCSDGRHNRISKSIHRSHFIVRSANIQAISPPVQSAQSLLKFPKISPSEPLHHLISADRLPLRLQENGHTRPSTSTIYILISALYIFKLLVTVSRLVMSSCNCSTAQVSLRLSRIYCMFHQTIYIYIWFIAGGRHRGQLGAGRGDSEPQTGGYW